MLDSERCVMCSRCIRFSATTCQQDPVSSASSTVAPGWRSAPFGIGRWKTTYAGNYADVCPVGALTSKDFRFQSRVWFLERTESVCPHCSTGCNIRVDHKNSTDVHRFVPRRNARGQRTPGCAIVGRTSYADPESGRPGSARGTEATAAVTGSSNRLMSWDDVTANRSPAGAPGGARRGSGPEVGRRRGDAAGDLRGAVGVRRQLMSGAVGSPHRRLPGRPEHGNGVGEREDEAPAACGSTIAQYSRGAEILLGVVPGEGGLAVRASCSTEPPRGR